MKTLFFGTSAFAVPSLRVVAAQTACAGVVTQPDRPAGRGHRLRSTPVKLAALELGLEVFEPLRLRDFAVSLRARTFDLFAVAAYGRILPPELLALPRLGALNVHPSLLPKYRGATPIQAAILAGDNQTGVCIMSMDCGLDTGDIVALQRTAIAAGETYGELHDRLARIGADLLGATLAQAKRGALAARPQAGEVTLTRPIVKADLAVDWKWAPERILRTIRAYSPQPAARGVINGENVKVLRAHLGGAGEVVVDEMIAPNRGRTKPR